MRKQKTMDAIRAISVHNKEDLMLIQQTLRAKNDSFKVLCGCVALERFLSEEKRLQSLAEHFEKGAVRVDPDLKQVLPSKLELFANKLDVGVGAQTPH